MLDDFFVFFRNGPEMIFDGSACSGLDHIENHGRGIGQFAFNIGFYGGPDRIIDNPVAQDGGQDKNQGITAQKLGADTQISEKCRHLWDLL